MGAEAAMPRPMALKVPFGLLSGAKFGLDWRNHKQLYFGLWEREALLWTKRLTLGARTAIDVGAGEGEYTLFFARLVTISRVVAVEPDPEALNKLLSNLRLNGLDSGRHVEIVTMSAGAADDGATRRLDSMVPGPTLPLMVKVDVEGSEVDVLAGAMRLLRLPDVRILIETHGADLEAQCLTLLAGMGFETRILRRARWRAFVPERRLLSHNQWLVAWKKPLT